MSAGKGDTPRAVNGEVFRRNYEAIFGPKMHPLKVNEPLKDDLMHALAWCAAWLDTLCDHLCAPVANEMLEDLSKTRRENPALDEAFFSIGWTLEAEANFFKARLIPEEGEE